MGPMTESDSQYYEALANEILRSNSQFFASYLLSNPLGAVLGEAVRPSHKGTLGGIAQIAAGMAPLWCVLSFTLMQRLDKMISRADYITVGRAENQGIIFSLPKDQSVIVWVVFDKELVQAGLYEAIVKTITKFQLSIPNLHIGI